MELTRVFITLILVPSIVIGYPARMLRSIVHVTCLLITLIAGLIVVAYLLLSHLYHLSFTRH